MNQPIVEFLNVLSIPEHDLTYSIVCSKFQNKWIFVRHWERETWEMPAGHIEEGESALAAAKRELYEETGAKQFSLRCICDYSCIWNGEKKYGRIFFSYIFQLGELPQSEIAEIKFFNVLPKSLTYPHIQNLVFEKVLMSLNNTIFTSYN